MDLICNGANVEDCLNLFNKVEILSNLKNFLLKNISESLSKQNKKIMTNLSQLMALVCLTPCITE